MSATEVVRKVAAGWARFPYGLPSECEVQDWKPTPLCCSRWVVVVTHTGWTHDDAPEFLGEFWTRREASQAANRWQKVMEAEYDKKRNSAAA